MTTITTAWIDRFDRLWHLEDIDRDYLLRHAKTVTLPVKTTIFAPGQPAENFVLLLDGVVRVQQIAPNGREIILYRVSGGESCIMTTACLLSHEAYAAEGVTETTVRAVTLPRAAFDNLMARSAGFRSFVFAGYADRMADLLALVEAVAFQRVDKRLAQRLVDRADAQGRLRVTHQALAVELGSAREVISRQLKEFERRGWLSLTRGEIRLSDAAALVHLARAD